jgi:hypothetical protein
MAHFHSKPACVTKVRTPFELLCNHFFLFVKARTRTYTHDDKTVQTFRSKPRKVLKLKIYRNFSYKRWVLLSPFSRESKSLSPFSRESKLHSPISVESRLLAPFSRESKSLSPFSRESKLLSPFLH